MFRLPRNIHHLQGHTFHSLLKGSRHPIRDSALTENAQRKAITTGHWRYVANIGDQPDELYDQQNDPWEMTNLIDDPRGYMQTSLCRLRRERV